MHPFKKAINIFTLLTSSALSAPEFVCSYFLLIFNLFVLPLLSERLEKIQYECVLLIRLYQTGTLQ